MSTVRLATDATLAQIALSVANDPIAALDGTQATYNKVMRQWFISNGAQDYVNNSDYDSLTSLCDKWYMLTRDDWCGYTEFYQPDVSSVSTGTKGGDNADLECTPSTDTTANTDDYAGLPLFACVDANFIVDETTLRPVITAIDGITDNFKRFDTSTYVGVMQMSGWHFWTDTDDTFIVGYAANRNIPYRNIEPLPEAVNPDDNSFRQWVVHAKYMSHTTSSALTSCAGVIPTTFLSHNTVHTRSKVNGSQYSGTCACDDAFLKLMAFIKYGSLSLDGILQGCVNNNYQYPAQVAEESVSRVLISSSHNLEVGESVQIATYASSLDRGTLNSTLIGYGTITAIETETVDNTDYAAIYIDTSDWDSTTFDTTANGASTSGTTYVSTWHWITGSTDGVLGNDGSPTDPTTGVYPAKLQGIEYMNGCYEIIADCILSLYLGDDEETYYYEPYITNVAADQNTALTDDYTATGCIIEQPSSAAWYYIKSLYMTNGVWFPKEIGGSSSTYMKDGFYMNAASTGTREWLSRGTLNSGVTHGGLSGVHGGHALSAALWNFGARLSANGNRGEFTA